MTDLSHPAPAPVAVTQAFGAARAAPDRGSRVFGDDGLTFEDVIDTLNPLHHLPVVSAVYRHLTGDQIAPGPRILGGALFGGGPLGAAMGAASAVVNLGIEAATGRDIGAHAIALFDGDDAASTQVAQTAQSTHTEIEGLPWLETPVAARAVEGLPWRVPEVAAAELPAIPPAAASPATSPATPPAAQAPQPWLAATPKPAAVATLPPDIPVELLVAEQSAPPPRAAKRPAADPRPTADPHHPPQPGPVDISEAMSAALEKYAAMTRARTGGTNADAF